MRTEDVSLSSHTRRCARFDDMDEVLMFVRSIYSFDNGTDIDACWLLGADEGDQ